MVKPEDINNEDADFLFQKKLYVGLDANQFEVRKRFEDAEQAVATLAGKQTATEGTATALTGRVGALETEQGRLKTEQTNLANAQSSQNDTLTQVESTSETHAGNSTIHVSEILRNHPTDATVHVPGGGMSPTRTNSRIRPTSCTGRSSRGRSPTTKIFCAANTAAASG